jgi:Uma2 family endonuclease
MAAIASKTRFTPDDLLRLPDRNGYELSGGQLVERPVSKESSRIGATVVWLLRQAAAARNDVEVFGADLGYQCFPNDPQLVRKPDASAIRREKLAGLGDPGFMPIPADLVVEVVSPNDISANLREKVEEYISAGFGRVWVIYPDARLLDVYGSGGLVATLHENDEITGEPALPDFRCRVAEFFL